jgi:hypothetical protein
VSGNRALTTRVSDALSLGGGDPLVVLYGPGSSDNFVDADYRVRTLEEAIWQVLRNTGYRRVVFTSADVPWYCLDAESDDFFARKLGDSGRRGRPAPHDGSVMSEKASTRQQKDANTLSGGNPVHGEAARQSMVVPVSRAAGGTRDQSLDQQALALLNACLQSRQVPTALVIIRANDYLRFNSADRELAGWFAQWQQTPADVDNLCVLVFPDRSVAKAIESVTALGYANVLVPCLERQRSRPVGHGSGEITEPAAAEIERVIHRARLLSGLRIADWTEFDRIVGALAAQPGVPVLNWARRLHKLAGDGVSLSLDAIRREAWVESLPSGQSAWDRLTGLTGLAEVKEHIDRIRWRAEAEAKRRRRGGRVRQTGSLHMVFTGGPGTGKTTVARLIGELYREMGLLRRGHLHAPEASDLIGMYVGHTAVQTSAAVDEALDGVLFIDEAYRLSEAPGGFGQEAIDTLITRMDNERERLVVIVAGYPGKMATFLRSNPGLPRRFPRGNVLAFPDYEPDALHAIVLGMLRDRDLSWVPELEPLLARVVTGIYQARDETFGNAGEMRNLTEELETNWARRTRADIEEPVTPEDLPASYRGFACGSI